MNRNYIFLAALLIILAGGVFLLPTRTNYQQIDPETLMRDIVQPSRFVTTDQVAEMIIQGDPTLELVDVRPIDQYETFTLPRAVNIPLDSILVKDYQNYLGIKNMKVVFFSDDDIVANRTWVIAKRMGFNSLYVMKGGLNEWIKTIIQPEVPPETASETEIEIYNFRKAAAIYFTGSKITDSEESSQSAITITRKKKSSAVEGGC